MQRFGFLASSLILAAILFTLVGCGGGNAVEEVQTSPEAKQADNVGQQAMQDYMKSMKSKSK